MQAIPLAARLKIIHVFELIHDLINFDLAANDILDKFSSLVEECRCFITNSKVPKIYSESIKSSLQTIGTHLAELNFLNVNCMKYDAEVINHALLPSCLSLIGQTYQGWKKAVGAGEWLDEKNIVVETLLVFLPTSSTVTPTIANEALKLLKDELYNMDEWDKSRDGNIIFSMVNDILKNRAVVRSRRPSLAPEIKITSDSSPQIQRTKSDDKLRVTDPPFADYTLTVKENSLSRQSRSFSSMELTKDSSIPLTNSHSNFKFPINIFNFDSEPSQSDLTQLQHLERQVEVALADRPPARGRQSKRTKSWTKLRASEPQEPKPKCETTAATTIQGAFRGWIARRSYKQQSMRKMIVQELIETEYSYLEGLFHCLKAIMYYLPLKTKCFKKRPVLLEKDCDILFFRIPEILKFTQQLYKLIKERMRAWHVDQQIGDVFLNMDFCEFYVPFVNNYTKALMTYNEYKSQTAFKSFLAKVRLSQDRRALDLLDLLILPVQRIPRYILLLKEVLKVTGEAHEDRQFIGWAITRLQDAAQVINDKIGLSMKLNAVMLLKVNNLPINIVQPNRYIVLEGELVEEVDSVRKNRYCYLFTDMFLATSVSKSSGRASTEYKWMVNLLDLELLSDNILENDGEETDTLIFLSWLQSGSICQKILLAEDVRDKTRWVEAISYAKAECQKKGKAGLVGARKSESSLHVKKPGDKLLHTRSLDYLMASKERSSASAKGSKSKFFEK